ncbi:MAG: FecR family protein [Bacteroidales bacterium]|nr:FecR family protein [Bacteroidales bacterium]
MSEDRIRQWLQSRYNNEGAAPEEIEEWILQNGDSPEFDGMMLELLERTEYFDPVSSSQGYSVFKSRIREYHRKRRREGFLRVLRGVERSAAILLLPVSAMMFYLGGRSADVEWLEANTTAGQKMEIMLPDGSDMTLGPSTKLIYPSAFNGNERKVFVMGAVYADIKSDAEKPFVVSTGCLDIKVLGTEFQLNSYEGDSETEIALVEGSVQLFNKSDNREVKMRPGDIVCYDKSTGNFIRKNFAAGYYKDILENGGFQFVNQRFGDIAACLERHFGVIIHIDDTHIMNERYFASFINNETVDEILSVLNAQNYMKITRSGKIINISRNNQ